MITLTILLSLGYENLSDDKNPTHYCEDRQLMAHCFSISPTSKTCYQFPGHLGAKRCSSLWKFIASASIPTPEPFYDYTQDPDGIHCYLQGYLERRVICDEIT